MFTDQELIRHRCIDCGLVFGPSKMFFKDKQEISNMYKDLYSRYSESDDPSREIAAFNELNPKKVNEDGEHVYLNYGAGRSPSQKHLSQYAVLCYDPMLDGIKRFEYNFFSGLFSSNLIEHLVQPYDDLNEMLMISADQAHFCPCSADDSLGIAPFQYANTIFHTIFWTKKSLDIFCYKLGVEFYTKAYKDGFILRIIRKPDFMASMGY